uniref:PDZ domain-containing protein n=1 Tax=Astyanax mexicanus TaxID=7994 RepID=A0A8B9J560_ASTMX
EIEPVYRGKHPNPVRGPGCVVEGGAAGVWCAPPGMASELKPRLCCMAKGEQGYGFHLHGEKGKSGQYIRKVEPASPAEASGLRAGDRVVEVNGENVERETHHQVSS